jgi:hypothetical protein
MNGALALLPIEQRRLILKRRRQRAWVRKARAANPDLYRERVRANRKRLVTLGYYRKGGKGYSKPETSAKRRAYFRWYNEHIRRPRELARRSHV